METKTYSGKLILLLALAVAGGISSAQAESGDAELDIRFLVQPWIQLTEAGAPDGSSLGKDAYLKRTRIILSGRISRRIAFFAETDIPEWGRGGRWESEWILQDAYLDFTLMEDRGPVDRLNLAVGMILLPFSHHNRQSAASLNTLNYHGGLIRFPDGSHNAWRDNGIELRGLLLRKRLDVRLGVFNGSRGILNREFKINPRDLPRCTGRMQINLLDPEEGFFYGGTYLGEKRVLSIGLGMDYQPDAFATGRSEDPSADFLGLAADLFMDTPLGQDRELSFQAGYFVYEHGRPEAYASSFRTESGRALGLEAGMRFGRFQPVLSYERFDPDRGADGLESFRNLRFGLNVWLTGHRCNLKTEYALLKSGGEASFRGVWTTQVQLLF